MASRRSRLQIRPNLSRGGPSNVAVRGKKPDESTENVNNATTTANSLIVGNNTEIVAENTFTDEHHPENVPPEKQKDTSDVLMKPPDVLMKPPDVLMISPDVLMKSPDVLMKPPEIPQLETMMQPTGASSDAAADSNVTTSTVSMVKPSAVTRRNRFKPQVKIRPTKHNVPKPTAHSIEIENKDNAEDTVHTDTQTVMEKVSQVPQPVTIETPNSIDKNPELFSKISIPTTEVSPDIPETTIVNTPDVKSLAKKSRFMRARPNFLEAERRHRLSSMSESEDSVTPRRIHRPSECDNPDNKLKSTTTHEPSKNDTDVVVKEKPKSKRRQSVRIETSVSENRTKFTISDLIHMNPVSNPMKRYLTKEPEKKKVVQEEHNVDGVDPVIPDALSPGPPTGSVLGSPPASVAGDEPNNDEALPVPQVMIGPDGNIIINDASLVIDNPATQPDQTIIESDVVVDNDNYNPAFYYRARKRSGLWTIRETTKFYVALSTVGTDFSLMTNLFPKRNRTELKRKFKQEERKHQVLVERALKECLPLDMSVFELSESDDSPSEDQENRPNDPSIANDVQTILKGEKAKGKKRKAPSASNKNEKKSKKKKDPKEKKEQTEKKKKSKKPKKKSRGKSRYYVDSSTESEDEVPMEETIDVDEEEGGDELLTLEKLSDSTTRSGRTPKVTKLFAMPDSEPRRRRHSSTQGIDPGLAPLVATTPSGTSHKVLEDPATGQRLLLVKSPPPVNSSHHKDKSDFVHVYLMSPSTPRSRRQSEANDVIEKENEPFVPLQMKSSHPISLQEEIITDEINVMLTPKRAMSHVRISPQTSRPSLIVSPTATPPTCIDYSTPTRTFKYNPVFSRTPPRHVAPIVNVPSHTETRPSVQSPTLLMAGSSGSSSQTLPSTSFQSPPVLDASPQLLSLTPVPLVIQTPSQSSDSIRVKMQDDDEETTEVYDNAEFLTVTDNDGNIVEILIDPGQMTQNNESDEECTVIDLQVTHPPGGGSPVVSLLHHPNQSETSDSKS